MLRVLLRVRLAIVLVSAVAGWAGWHARATGEESAVQSVVRTYEVALMHGDGETACAQLTDQAKQQLLAAASRTGIGGTCGQVGQAMQHYVDALIARAPSPERAAEARDMIENPPIDVDSVRGSTATARVRGIAGETIPLVHTEAGWRISGFPALGG
jgi:hypothetical protein